MLSLAIMAASLWVCRVRDPRCYGVALISSPVIIGAQLGNVSIMITLLSALTWRYGSAVATGASIALKLFAWPLLVYLVAIRGVKVGFRAALISVGLILASWMTIGFADLTSWPTMLRVVSTVYADDTFSISGAAIPGAPVIAAAVAAACLVGCWRHGSRGNRVASFALAVGAALAASPIVWLFYLTVLFVVIAAGFPRLHPVWMAPLLLWLRTIFDLDPVSDRVLVTGISAGVIGFVVLSSRTTFIRAYDAPRLPPIRCDTSAS